MDDKNGHHFNCCSSPSRPIHQQSGGQETNQDDFQEFINQALYESDEFRIYTYKIKRCPNLRSHDWTSCPFTHRGEKARRRDPRQYNYLPIPCPSYKFGSCIKGDNCELCHGVFEYWLHPAKYRTYPCHSGMSCERRVCFFAHTLEELRPETQYNWCYVYQYPLHIQPYPDILIEDESAGTWMVISSNHHLPSPPPPSHYEYYGTTVSEHGNSSTSQQIPPLSSFQSAWMVISNNHHLPSPPSPSHCEYYGTTVSKHGNSSTSQQIPPLSSFQSKPKIDQTVQNESDFSLFSTSYSSLVEELKNLEIGTTSHGRVNNMHAEKGKRPVEFDSQDQEFQNITWVSELLVDEFEEKSL